MYSSCCCSSRCRVNFTIRLEISIPLFSLACAIHFVKTCARLRTVALLSYVLRLHKAATSLNDMHSRWVNSANRMCVANTYKHKHKWYSGYLFRSAGVYVLVCRRHSTQMYEENTIEWEAEGRRYLDRTLCQPKILIWLLCKSLCEYVWNIPLNLKRRS